MTIVAEPTWLPEVRALNEEMDRRYKVLRGLPRGDCPDGILTAALSERADLGLQPIVLTVDAAQIPSPLACPCHACGAPRYDAAYALLASLVKKGPAVGITVTIITTARPSSASTTERTTP